ncbi:phage baseplate assembly protein V [Lutispora saccharofermentans]|uniref:Phage baseplate assembly protein V n=1 Tax=Lutispora saccharofermentans TaxID=3024236 RepID=A0ABT1NK17_9FIRM|nr:phage baseplate assembly protein V [Lutispora saccharofermentans]MCQ1530478.1 phage baseplate assembly protein V [Lutispora saccharofermentans]
MEKEKVRNIHGITTGTVTENWDADGEHPGMVKVEVFLEEEGKTMTDWMQVAQPYACNGYGTYWLPEVGDEVLLAFHGGEVSRYYVIGSLWSKKDKERLEIHTPKNLKITLEDEKQMIVIQDKDGKNMLQIDGENGKIVIAAEDNISFKAGGDRASLELDGRGGKAALKADIISLKANASLNIQSCGILDLKGSMIKIN